MGEMGSSGAEASAEGAAAATYFAAFRHRGWVLAALAVFPIAAVIIVAQQGSAAWQLSLGDTDNYMRLVEVRDWLGGQSWWDVSQHRVNPPAGLDTHWSRLGDLPYALPILLLRLLVSAETAERIAVVAMPPLLLLLTLLASARLADRIAGWRAALCSSLLIAASPQILAQFVPGRIDHHGLQLLLLISAIAFAVGRDSFANGFGAALLAALSLAVGLETAPYLAAMATWFVSRWVVRGGETRAKTFGFVLGLAMLVPLVAALTIPLSGWAEAQHDALGRGHVLAALLGGGAFAIAMAALRQDILAGRLLQAGLGAAASIAAVAMFPEIVRAPYSAIDPLLQRLWIANLGETRNFLDYWRASPLIAVARMAFLAIGTLAAVLLAATAQRGERDRYALLLLLALTAWPLALWQARAGAGATIVIIPIAAAALARLWVRWSEGGSVLPLAAAALLLNPVCVAGLLSGLHVLTTSSSDNGRIATGQARAERCEGPSQFRGLADLERGLILNPIDQSATILARTPHSVITAGNHRNAEANRRGYRVLAAPSPAAHALVGEIGADYVVFCSTAPEVRNFVRFAPDGLLASLAEGRIPTWLIRISDAGSAELRVYKVIRRTDPPRPE